MPSVRLDCSLQIDCMLLVTKSYLFCLQFSDVSPLKWVMSGSVQGLKEHILDSYL